MAVLECMVLHWASPGLLFPKAFLLRSAALDQYSTVHPAVVDQAVVAVEALVAAVAAVVVPEVGNPFSGYIFFILRTINDIADFTDQRMGMRGFI